MTTHRKPAQLELSLVRGDSRTWRFDIKLDGNPLDVSAGTISFVADNGRGDTITVAGSVAGVGSNEVTFSFTPTLSAVPLDDYDYDIQQIVGADRYTYVEGVLHITQDVNLT